MKRNNPDHTTLTIHIPEDIYTRVLEVIKTHELPEESALQKIVSAGLLKHKIDSIKEENTSLYIQIENLRNETKRFIEENSRLERVCSESEKDQDYIYKRLEELDAENQELEALVRQQNSTKLKGN
ncbi:MAG TPA: hypothetical protein VHT73_00635 [Thermodesulfobacteriota bacterium]|nr:hypothetical protein [Thermodesulfobacteriota bacterium]